MKYLYLYLLCILYNVLLPAQLSIQHTHTIKNIFVDSFSNVLFIDVNNGLYYLDGTVNKPYDIEYSRVTPKQAQNNSNLISLDGASYLYEKGKLVKQEDSVLYKSSDILLSLSKGELELTHNMQKCNVEISEPIVDFSFTHKSHIILFRNSVLEICSNQSYALDFDATSITALDNESFIISSTEKGLWIYNDGGEFKKYYVPGVPFPKSFINVNYREGSLWMLTSQNDLIRYDVNRQILQKVAVNVSDYGFDKWNKLWYVSGRNLTYNINFTNRQPPNLEITEIEINNRKEDLFASNILSSASDKIKLFYKVEYSPSKDVDVTYRLNGNKWKRSKTSPIDFSFENEGRHEVEIRAIYNDNYYSEIMSLSFEVKERFIGSLWFYTFLGLLGLIGLLLLSQLRVARANKLLEAERKALKLELALVKKEQKLGQLQLNPHFIFNTMNSINGLIALDRKADARKALATFAKIMRSVLSFSFDEKIDIDVEIKFLKDYIELERLIRDNLFEFQINCNLKNVAIPPMLIQPFVENAIIHGLQHKKSKGFLKIDIDASGSYINVVVTDDGVGREKAKQFKKETHESSAIRIVKDRILSLDKWKAETPIAYIDLYNDGMAVGTKCILNIPK